jgi:hypothetical protein
MREIVADSYESRKQHVKKKRRQAGSEGQKVVFGVQVRSVQNTSKVVRRVGILALQSRRKFLVGWTIILPQCTGRQLDISVPVAN